jgi:uncharacterized protein YbbC (DUF1343 family)
MDVLPAVGIDILLQDPHALNTLSKQRVGIVTNKCTLTKDRIPSAYALYSKIGEALKCILTPEHGWSGVIAEGVKVADEVDSETGLPVFSLYEGGIKHFDVLKVPPLDTLIIDLQDIGLRCYTYAATCAKFLERYEGEVIVCDRPNPLGPQQKGPDLDPAYRSLLAYLDVPFQHGKTMGGLLSHFKEKLPLKIIDCEPYHKPYAYVWQPPSPNLPSWQSVLLYPALVMLEGVNVSEGRGTPFPFTSLGAPDLDHKELVDFLNQLPYEGVVASPITFVPERSKWMGKECQGVRLVLEEGAAFDAFSYGTDLLRFLRRQYTAFEWLPMPKERYFIDALMGTDSFRQEVERA